MADPRFFPARGPLTVAEIAARTGAATRGDPTRVLRDVAALEDAGSTDLAYFDQPRYRDVLATTRAGAIALHPRHRERAPPGAALLLSESPYRVFALAAAAFHPPPPVTPGIAAGAHVDPAAEFGEGCAVAPGAVIGAGVRIGARCSVEAGAVIANGVSLGDDVRIGVGASLTCCDVGSR